MRRGRRVERALQECVECGGDENFEGLDTRQLAERLGYGECREPVIGQLQLRMDLLSPFLKGRMRRDIGVRAKEFPVMASLVANS
jgi:hypothetical protein